MGAGWVQGLRDVLQHRWLVLRGALIGVWAGILPALGATAGTWMAYGHVVAASRDKSRFGRGDIRGIIAPEAANNAVAAGDLIPTLLFWVPGSASAALLVGTLLRHGILPGPRIVSEHLSLIYVIIWSYAIANVVGAGLCFLISPGLARITHVPFARLAGPVLMTITLGAFQATQNMADLITLFIIGLLGWAMSRTGWPRAPFLIGFVLAGPMERNFVITTNLLQGWGWLTRPGVVIIGAILVAPFVVGLARWLRSRRGGSVAAEERVQRVALDVVLSAALLLVFLGAAAMASQYAPGARLLPMVAAVPGAGLAGWQLVRALQGQSVAGDDGPPSATEVRGGLVAFLALAGCFVLIRLVGFHAAAVAFMLAFTLGPARMRPLPAVLFIGAVMIFVTGLGSLLGVRWPTGLVRF